jgi:hypothetical protein
VAIYKGKWQGLKFYTVYKKQAGSKDDKRKQRAKQQTWYGGAFL